MAAKKTTTTNDSMKKGTAPKAAPKAPAGAKASAPAKGKAGKAAPKAKAAAAVKAAPKAKPAAKSKAKSATKAAPPKAARASKAPAVKAAPAPKAKAAKRGNPVLHWEIQSTQPEVLHDFYSEVFGWAIDANNPMKYGMVSSKGLAGGIDGGIGDAMHGASRVLVYASVQSIPPVLARIEQRGGRTLMPRTDIGPVVMAIYTDPEGNTMGLIEDR
jgi:predicted enzyme related to lactoylglutathione lyase